MNLSISEQALGNTRRQRINSLRMESPHMSRMREGVVAGNRVDWVGGGVCGGVIILC